MIHAVHEVILNRLPEIAELCREYGVERLDVFGSAARDDFDPSRSDVDLLVKFMGDTARRTSGGAFIYSHGAACEALEKALEQLLGRNVDLIPEGGIRNPYILRTVEEDRIRIYEA